MELSRPFNGNGFLRGDACAALPSFAGVGREPGREFALAAVSHLDVGSLWQAIAPKLLVDLSYPLFFMARKDLAIPQSTHNMAGFCDSRNGRTGIRVLDDRIWSH